MGASCTVLVVEAIIFNILDDWLRDEVSDTHITLSEEADLGAGNVILHKLLHDMDVLLPLLEGRKGFVDVGTRSL